MPCNLPAQNLPKTLRRARVQIHGITTALSTEAVTYHWTWTSGYLPELAFERLIDEDTKRMLDDEADRARDDWRSPAEVSVSEINATAYG